MDQHDDQHDDQPVRPLSPPNFGLLAREFQKCTQLPVFDQGAAIMHALTQINGSLQNVNQRIDGLNQRINGLEHSLNQRINGLEHSLNQRMDSQDHNMMARLQNAKKANLTDTLIPLHDRVNQPIDQFPDTLSAIERLRGDDLNRILGALGSGVNGTESEKRTALRMALGLHTV